MSSKPDFDQIARHIHERVNSPLDREKTIEWTAAKLGVIYQEGVVDGLAIGAQAVDAAFAKQREAKP